jgi:membrane protein DedA with SNARE-associated domain
MNLGDISREIVNFAGTFNVWLVISIFLLLTVNEFGFAIPYLMETVWILAGYHARNEMLPAYQVVLLMAVAMGGRVLGSFLLYSIIGLGSNWLMRLYRRIFGDTLSANAEAKSLPARVMKRLNLFSPFMVAGGRLIWLKVPLTITLGVRRDLKVLEPAVMISSLIWDGTYILVGVLLGNLHTEPPYLILYSLTVLSVIYGATFLVRRVLTRRALKSGKSA